MTGKLPRPLVPGSTGGGGTGILALADLRIYLPVGVGIPPAAPGGQEHHQGAKPRCQSLFHAVSSRAEQSLCKALSRSLSIPQSKDLFCQPWTYFNTSGGVCHPARIASANLGFHPSPHFFFFLRKKKKKQKEECRGTPCLALRSLWSCLGQKAPTIAWSPSWQPWPVGRYSNQNRKARRTGFFGPTGCP